MDCIFKGAFLKARVIPDSSLIKMRKQYSKIDPPSFSYWMLNSTPHHQKTRNQFVLSFMDPSFHCCETEQPFSA